MNAPIVGIQLDKEKFFAYLKEIGTSAEEFIVEGKLPENSSEPIVIIETRAENHCEYHLSFSGKTFEEIAENVVDKFEIFCNKYKEIMKEDIPYKCPEDVEVYG